ncbi:hypothetical protein pb186bvf_008589 [Paramecium bursaria]
MIKLSFQNFPLNYNILAIFGLYLNTIQFLIFFNVQIPLQKCVSSFIYFRLVLRLKKKLDFHNNILFLKKLQYSLIFRVILWLNQGISDKFK